MRNVIKIVDAIVNAGQVLKMSGERHDHDVSDDGGSSVSSNSSDNSDQNQQRDLTNDEIEKLIQLQDLTGIEDLQICRALLESKDWDLEATAREHLNIPAPPSRVPDHPPVPIAPMEAPEARAVMRPNHIPR